VGQAVPPVDRLKAGLMLFHVKQPNSLVSRETGGCGTGGSACQPAESRLDAVSRETTKFPCFT
jgi:hypothetical protein